MKPLNPIFNNKAANSSLTNTSNVRKKPITKEEGRKERCDKLKHVKIPFNEKERMLIKQLAKKRGLDPTPYIGFLLMKALKRNYDFPECVYKPQGQPYPAKISIYYHDLLFDYKVKWDCSLKESAYRIVSFMLEKERRELQ
ncbi:hypothetical protein [Metabacillus fastidiosus]|uniref:hypothetical protein n=1 Tax=Metabacillus fastidiosus TaxID=1458 RepID=UPI002E2270A9|nr:hypothetical protein [Metabacillus fastidiosus]